MRPPTRRHSPLRSFAWVLFLAAGMSVPFAAVRAAADTTDRTPEGVSQDLVLPPGPDNPRNSEGDFAVLDGGRVLFVYTHFTGGSGDAASAYLAGRWSSDGGKTWGERDEVVVEKPPGVQNVMSVSLLPLGGGRVALFYLVKKSDRDCRAVMRVSADGCKTWGEPVPCMPEEGYFVVNNGRAVRLASGRIVLPAARHDRASKKPGAGRGVAVCFFSDDEGKTWRRSRSELEAPPGSRSGLQEPLVVELKADPVAGSAAGGGAKRAGRLMMLCRTDQGCQFRSYSDDGGDTWSEAAPTDIASPLSPASVKRISSTGDLLLVWNDHSNVKPALRDKRTPLTVAVSKDEGKTWEHRRTLYDDEQGWYCYTAIAFAGDRVLLGHCAGRREGKSHGLERTVVTSFDVGWLYR